MFHRAARSSVLLFTVSLLSIGSSKGQTTAPSISPELAYRIESMLRSKMEFPTAASISFGPRSASEVPGYDRIQAHFSSSLSGDKGDIPLLVSHDGSRVAQFTTYNIAADPGWKLSAEGHPARGGPASSPVVIVSYDDLECPFCARLHAALFPALMDRYRDQVRIVYRSFPLEGHPWAMHAAVDVDCLGAKAAQGYWAAVDEIHAHAGEYGGEERSLTKAEQELDDVVLNEGHRFHVDESALKACIKKQDTTLEAADIDAGKKLGVYKTPTFFINGMKLDGAVPISFVFKMVDNALKAEGLAPPTSARKEAATAAP